MLDPRLYPTSGAADGTKFWTRMDERAVAFNPAAVAAVTVSNQTVTVTGVVAATDRILAFSAGANLSTGLAVVGARISANNEITLTFVNPTAGSIDQGSLDFTFLVGRLGSYSS